MNAPVTAAPPAVRSTAPRASDTGRAHSAAPFASALDGAINEHRAHASDRGADRRHTAEDRAARADERAVTEDHRSDRARAAGRRSDDHAARADARADRAAERATRKAAEKAARESADAIHGRPADDATVPDEPAQETADGTTEAAGQSAEAPRGGLPALWALLMGSAPAAGSTDGTSADEGPAPSTPLPGGAAVETTGTGSPAETVPSALVPSLGAAVPVPAAATGDPSAPVPAPAAPAAAPATPLAGGLPAALSAVLAETGAVVTGSGTTGAAVPSAPASSGVPALPVDLVLDAASAAGTPSTGAPTVAPAPTPVATDGGTDAAVTPASGSADAVVAPVGGTAGQALSADAGGAGGDDTPPPPGTAQQPPVGPAASAAPPTTAAVADVDGATGAAATLPVGSQVARQVAVLGGGPDGNHSMTLVLTPETLGEVQVQVTLSKGSIELALRGAHEHGRAALMDALPELRRELEAAGLNPSRMEVARDTGGSWLDRQPTPQQQGFGERGGSQDRGENRSRPWGRPADIAGSGPSLNPNRSTSSGVDVRV